MCLTWASQPVGEMIDDLLFRTLDLKNQVQTLAMIIARMLLGEQIPNLPSTIL